MVNKFSFGISYIIFVLTIINIYINDNLETKYSKLTYFFISTIQILILKLIYSKSYNLFIIFYLIFISFLLYDCYNKVNKKYKLL
jgi:hypothetical protein